MKSRRYLALTIAPFLALAACTAIAGLDGEYGIGDGGAGTTPETGSTTSSSSSSSSGNIEAGNPDGSSSTSSGTVDSGKPDTGPVDGGPPGAPTAFYPTSVDQGNGNAVRDAAATSQSFVCDAPFPHTAPNLCWDFGGSSWDAPAIWTPQAVTGGGAVSVSGAVNAKVRHMVASAPAAGEAAFTFTMPVSGTQTYEAYVSVQIPTVKAYAVVVALRLPGTTKQYGLAVHPGGWYGVDAIGENLSSARDTKGLLPYDPGVWYRVRIALKKSPNTDDWAGKIDVGNKTLSNRPDALNGPLQSPSGKGLEVVIGTFDTRTGQPGSTQVKLDDVITGTAGSL